MHNSLKVTTLRISSFSLNLLMTSLSMVLCPFSTNYNSLWKCLHHCSKIYMAMGGSDQLCSPFTTWLGQCTRLYEGESGLNSNCVCK